MLTTLLQPAASILSPYRAKKNGALQRQTVAPNLLLLRGLKANHKEDNATVD